MAGGREYAWQRRPRTGPRAGSARAARGAPRRASTRGPARPRAACRTAPLTFAHSLIVLECSGLRLTARRPCCRQGVTATSHHQSKCDAACTSDKSLPLAGWGACPRALRGGARAPSGVSLSLRRAAKAGPSWLLLLTCIAASSKAEGKEKAGRLSGLLVDHSMQSWGRGRKASKVGTERVTPTRARQRKERPGAPICFLLRGSSSVERGIPSPSSADRRPAAPWTILQFLWAVQDADGHLKDATAAVLRASSPEQAANRQHQQQQLWRHSTPAPQTRLPSRSQTASRTGPALWKKRAVSVKM